MFRYIGWPEGPDDSAMAAGELVWDDIVGGSPIWWTAIYRYGRRII